ncbi:unnamed protein product [Closterium sp. NIES-64]|nr:unnamed protein product [Closterium sp. NIES-64]
MGVMGTEWGRANSYPHCLYFLELLQSEHFRTAMAHPANKELAHGQQFYFWQHYRNNRLKMMHQQRQLQAAGEGETDTETSTGGPPSQGEPLLVPRLVMPPRPPFLLPRRCLPFPLLLILPGLYLTPSLLRQARDLVRQQQVRADPEKQQRTVAAHLP